MKEKKVGEILLPFRQEVPLHPSVKLEDRIIHAIELMVLNNLTCIAVIRKNKPVGMVRLEDAFEKVGLHGHSSL